MDQRITIQRATEATGSMGDVSKTWATLATVWAAVADAGGGRGEQLQDERTMATATTRFTLRQRSDVTTAMRIVWRGVVYNIRAIPDRSPRRLYMDVLAERGVGNEN